jgi:hypothetical protein
MSKHDGYEMNDRSTVSVKDFMHGDIKLSFMMKKMATLDVAQGFEKFFFYVI